MKITGEEPLKMKEVIHSFERHEPFSISFWFYAPDNKKNGYTLLNNCASTYHGFRGYNVLIIDGKPEFRISNSYPSNALSIQSVDSLPSKSWHHVLVTYDGSSKASGMGMYLNGKRVETKVLLDELNKTIRTHTLDAEREAHMLTTNLYRRNVNLL